MHLGKSNPRHKYKVTRNDGAVTLNSTKCEKDFGFYVDTELNFQCHAGRASSKANGPLGLAKRSFHHIDMNLFKSLFVGLVRPHLQCDKVAWTIFFKKDIKTIDEAWRRETRMIPELRD